MVIMPQESSFLRKAKDAWLVLQTKAGKEESYGAIYDRYFRIIYQYIYFKVSSQENAEDLTADVFFKVWQFIRSGKSVKNLRSLLFTAARNAVIDYYRKSKFDPFPKNAEELVEDTQVNVFDEVEKSDDRELLSAALDTLSTEEREVVLLRYTHELSFKEIGAIVGKRSGAVRVSVHRARKKLKKVLENKQKGDM